MQMFPLAMLPDTVAADAAVHGQQRAGVFTGSGQQPKPYPWRWARQWSD